MAPLLSGRFGEHSQMDLQAVTMERPAPLRPQCQRLSDPAAPPPAPLAARSRAAELLTAAAAHRTYVEHCLAGRGDQHRTDQHQAGQRLAEMMEGWMTGEDAFEVAMWHVAGTCDRGGG